MKKTNRLDSIAVMLRIYATECDKAGIEEPAKMLRYYADEIAEICKAFKPLVEYDFGDYMTPWEPLRVEGNRIEGAAKTADGFPFSLSSSCEFGFDAMIEMANIIGGLQSAMKSNEEGGAQ